MTNLISTKAQEMETKNIGRAQKGIQALLMEI